MKLLYDLQCTQSYGKTKFHGGGTYGRNLFVVLINQIRNGSLPDFLLKEIEVTKKKNYPFDGEVEKILHETGIKVIEVDNSREVIDYLVVSRPECFYSPLPETYVPFLNGKNKGSTRFLGTIHGLRDFEIHYTKIYVSYQKKFISRVRQRSREVFRKHYISILKKQYKKLFLVLDGFLTVSEHSKHQILLYFPEIEANSIKVLFPIQLQIPQKEPSLLDLKRFGLETGKYFLMLNSNRPVKNIFMVLDALNYFFRPEFSQFRYACIGFTEYQKNLIRRCYKRIYPLISFIDYVEPSILESLYKNSFSLVFPSISEGFGYPPLEAMKHSVPVLASGLSAIPEVCSDSALYFNPYDKSEIANRILQLILDVNLRVSLINKGLEHYQKYRSLNNEQISQFIDFVIKG